MFERLKDKKIRARLTARLDRLANGSFGDTRRLSATVSELRLTIGGGIRVYYTSPDKTVVLLLAGGNKATQTQDVRKAEALAKEFHDENHTI